MTFIHPLLLGGLVLVGVPILLHLIMRQKPKHLLFPAFRFLVQKQRTNQRKLRLRHLLLLALRIGLVALICLALARPRLFSERLQNLVGSQPVAVILLLDTSASMQYQVADRTRLEEAKRRALELLDDLPEGSRVALLDTAEPAGGQWLTGLALVRERLAALEVRPANGPVTSQLAEAYRLFARLDEELGELPEPMPRFLYVFSDRTAACWDPGQRKNLKELRQRVPQPPVSAVWIDVGIDKPSDLGIIHLDLPQQAVPGNVPVILRATVQATGGDYDTEIRCQIDNDSRTVQRQHVRLKGGQSPQVFEFRYTDLPAGFHQAEIALASRDNLPFNNVAFATFEVRGARQVLTITDDPDNVIFWRLALEKGESPFKCDLATLDKAGQMSPGELALYQAVCLVDVADPNREWDKLKRYVESGGGLAVVPTREQALRLEAYNDNASARAILPGRLRKVATAEPPLIWDDQTFKEPVLGWFRDWGRNPSIGFLRHPPEVRRYWEVEPASSQGILARYTSASGKPAGASPPALLESVLDRKQYRGRVLLFTVPLDDAHCYGEERWHDYVQALTPFFPALVKKTVGYLAGDAEEAAFNFRCGQAVPVLLPPAPRFPTYVLHGPGLSGAEAIVPRAERQSELSLTQPTQPGHFTLTGADGRLAAAFSLNPPWEESQLAKVPAEQIDDLLGQGSILSLPPGQPVTLGQVLQEHWSQPVELFPWLMIALLLVLAVENLLANRFYRREQA